MLFKYPTISC